jgi:hypothetical protein
MISFEPPLYISILLFLTDNFIIKYYLKWREEAVADDVEVKVQAPFTSHPSTIWLNTLLYHPYQRYLYFRRK